jgi:hypothetical protein
MIAGVLFDALFNLHKFVRFELRDPFAEKQKRDDPFECDWDRFAYFEYHRLAAEEEGEATEPDESHDISMEMDLIDSSASASSPGFGVLRKTEVEVTSPDSFETLSGYTNKQSDWFVDDDDDVVAAGRSVRTQSAHY